MQKNNPPTHKIDAAVETDEGAGVHIANHAIILNGQIAARLRTALGCWAIRSHYK